MKIDWFIKLLLLVIAIATSAIALRPYLAPDAVRAQASESALYPYYIEPGTFLLHAPDGSKTVLGRMVVDLRNGNIWGFPTVTADPYPTSSTSTTPATSHPFYMGKFAFSEMDKEGQ